ncbi:MAG: hypothetical protein Q7U24_03210, partial [Sulfurimicrobium sp.]|nr:hypothetical protein [Sulfurimicrobium sp.]
MNHDTSTHAAILGAAAIVSFLPAIALAAPAPTTPIEHVIVVVGENRTFDNLFATYQPQKAETVWNLLSNKIVRKDGSPGPNFHLAAQNKAVNTG